MNSRRGESVARRRLAGTVFLLVMALLAWLSVALYQKTFSSAAMVTLYAGSVGNEMHPGAQVMVRGVQVGEVRQVSADGSGARLLLAIQPRALPRLPANVSAMMLPTTLFGERYVDLLLPASPSVRTLADGSVIRQNRSADALELETVLNNLLPTLTAVQPDKLSLALTAIAQGLSGRGENLGHTLVTLNSYLRDMTPLLPQLDSDIKLLAGLTKTYTQAAPTLLAALNDFAATGQTIAAQRADFASLLANLTSTSDDLRAFLDANSSNLIRLSADSLPTLRILARYAAEFPCTLRRLAQFVPTMNKVLGAGSNQPGLHAQVVVVPSLGKYLPSRDTPVYGDNLGPHCYPVPFPGIQLHDGTSPPSSAASLRAGTGTRATTSARWPASGGSSRSPAADVANAARLSAVFSPERLAGSPAEAELLRELAGLSLGRKPAALPAWGSLLIAPLFRGARVVIR
jgi:phospholipid/cholesterol/gamma-HCH transport system substrate-binding protein